MPRTKSTRPFNTTPLVDIMLVLLIIFLITIPVVIKSVQITSPIASNIVTITKPENIILAVDKPGQRLLE